MNDIKGKRILVLTSTWLPNLSMNGIIMKNIIDELKDENEITVIAHRQNDDDQQVFQGREVKYIYGHPYRLNKANQKVKKKHTIANKTVIILLKCCSVIYRLLSPIGVNIEMCNKMYGSARKIISDEHFDYILAMGEPFTAVYTIDSLIRDDQKTPVPILMLLDRFASSEIKETPFVNINKRKRKRAEMLDRIASVGRIGVLNYAYEDEIKPLKNTKNVFPIGFPLIKNNSFISENNDKLTDNRISLVYTGSFSRDIRSPKECLKILTEISKEIDITVHIYHKGDCQDIVSRAAKESGGVIKNHGAVPIEEAYKAMADADVLIIVSTYDGSYVAGKTFDYIATGKPILFCYYNEKDANLPYMEKYGNSYAINLKDRLKNKNDLTKFLSDSRNSVIDYEIIKERFADDTPDRVVNKLFDGLDQKA